MSLLFIRSNVFWSPQISMTNRFLLATLFYLLCAENFFWGQQKINKISILPWKTRVISSHFKAKLEHMREHWKRWRITRGVERRQDCEKEILTQQQLTSLERFPFIQRLRNMLSVFFIKKCILLSNSRLFSHAGESAFLTDFNSAKKSQFFLLHFNISIFPVHSFYVCLSAWSELKCAFALSGGRASFACEYWQR